MRLLKLGCLVGGLCWLLTSAPAPAERTSVKESWFGKLPDGTAVEIYTLRNAHGVEARVTTYGAILVSLRVPDRKGQPGDVVAGFDTLESYIKSSPYFGATIGRYGNRIGRGRFKLNGVEYKLATNDRGNHLHGGERGYDKRVWRVIEAKPDTLLLGLRSTDGEEEYPGNLDVRVRYSVTAGSELKIEYDAVSDKDTIVNLTNHSYFNLHGNGGTILDHELTLNADRFTPVDASLIPTGELRPVAGTPMDFRKPAAIGARIDADDEQIRFGGGYDHNWVLNRTAEGILPAARLYDPISGRVLEVLTTEPGVQFYAGGGLDGTLKGKGGVVYGRRSALCLETQHYPDSPNKPQFPSTVLKAGQKFRSVTLLRFRVQ